MMRDDPMDAEPPEAFEPSDYYANSLDEGREKLRRLQSMSNDAIEEAAQKAHDEEIERIKAYNVQKAEKRERYETMLSQVQAWQPPSPDHNGLKDFMIEQLQTSIDADCSTTEVPVRPLPGEWWQQAVERAAMACASSAKNLEEEIVRTNSRNVWLRKLRESLK